jgi:radical SAM superfamily enzyme YgiQ (UPF0313 family)
VLLDLTALRFLEDPEGSSAPPAEVVAELVAGGHLRVGDGDAVGGGGGGGAATDGEAAMPVGPAEQTSFDLDTTPLVAICPTLLLLTPRGFEWYDHEGRCRLRLDARELAATVALCSPGLVAEAGERQQRQLGHDALTSSELRDLARRLADASLLVPFEEDAAGAYEARKQAELAAAIRGRAEVMRAFDRIDEEHDRVRPPTATIRVVPVHTTWNLLPAALGLVVDHAKAHDGGRLTEHYDFRPRFLTSEQQLRVDAEHPAVYLFTNYIWLHDEHMQLSAMLKELAPASITIHGGPHVPKYDDDIRRYFHDHPHVDVAVHGEGEATLAEALDALRAWDGSGPADLSVLADVPGLSYRTPSGPVSTGSRDRIADLDSIPSAILSGTFDGYRAAGPAGTVIIETNRGCPYGCTFCDWGSATLSRIRKFDLERVFAEIEWGARNRFMNLYLADANFGIFERDVEIAEHIVALKERYGAPSFVATNYAKNTVKHLGPIIDLLSAAGIVVEGKLSLQTMDEDTLVAVRRKNIKVEKYERLSEEFRKNELPLTVELMYGLPGSSAQTFRRDMQSCIDRDVRALMYPTVLLPNSPMNEPAYREEHRITAEIGGFVEETATFSREDWHKMQRLRDAFVMSDFFGALRYVLLYLRHETGIDEVALLEVMLDETTGDPERWPVLAFAFEAFTPMPMPPVSWSLLLDDARRYAVEQLGVPGDEALQDLLRVQLAHLPTRGRPFPATYELRHDVVAWHAAVQAARGAGHRHDWHLQVAPLRTYGPGRLEIEDPQGVCAGGMAATTGSLIVQSAGWELSSPMSRPFIVTSTAAS